MLSLDEIISLVVPHIYLVVPHIYHLPCKGSLDCLDYEFLCVKTVKTNIGNKNISDKNVGVDQMFLSINKK